MPQRAGVQVVTHSLTAARSTQRLVVIKTEIAPENSCAVDVRENVEILADLRCHKSASEYMLHESKVLYILN